MIKDFILPDIGEGIVECEIIKWLVNEGDAIVEDQVVAEVSTDKAVVEIPSMHTGRVVQLHYAQGDIARVHSPLFAIELDESSENDEAPAAVNRAEAAKEQTSSVAASPKTESSIDFILPDIGEGVVECEIIEWRVKEGDDIVEDQVVAEVSTDKAVVEIPSMHHGRITKLYYKQGEIAKVHAPLFAIAVEGQQVEAVEIRQADAITRPISEEVLPQPHNKTAGKVLTTPAVRRLARENNLDLTQVPATGKNGRVLKEDVLQYLTTGKESASGISQSVATTGRMEINAGSEDRIEPVKGVRAVMAKMMSEAVSTIPHFTYVDEIDVTDLIALRLKLKEQYAQQGIKITLMPLFIKALSLALKQFPVVNSQLSDDMTQLRYFGSHNIGMAVDSKVGLLVPNIKNVEQLSILDIAKEVSRLTDSARAGKVSPADLAGGTISISNVGAIGGTAATPIINKPEVAIVALGKIQKLPRFDVEGNVCARQIMTVSWSGDHRVIDGGTIARFNNLWAQYLQDPASMLTVMR